MNKLKKLQNLLLIHSVKAPKIGRFALMLLLVGTSLSAQEFNSFQDACGTDQPTFTALVGYIYALLTGGFGALIMIVSGIGAILAAAFGQYRAALSALVVALGVFVLQIFIVAFFGQDALDECTFR
ncbi:MAG: hypothetical protein QXL01_07735 [Thermoplasmatales archaeon]